MGERGAADGNYALYRGISWAAFPRSIACKSEALNRPTSRRPAAVAFAVRNGKSVPNTICVGFTSLVSDAKGWIVVVGWTLLFTALARRAYRHDTKRV